MPVKTVLNGSTVPVRIWTDDIDEGSKAQLANIASLPFIHKWIAVMPDAHQGMGAGQIGQGHVFDVEIIAAPRNVRVAGQGSVGHGMGQCQRTGPLAGTTRSMIALGVSPTVVATGGMGLLRLIRTI